MLRGRLIAPPVVEGELVVTIVVVEAEVTEEDVEVEADVLTEEGLEVEE